MIHRKTGLLFLKCLDANMRSCNGGDQRWQLSKWVTVTGPLSMCHRGVHLTLQPWKWTGTRVFVAEASGIADHDDNKFVCRKARLLVELSPEQLAKYRIASAQAWEAYQKVAAPALEAYQKVAAQAWEAFQKVAAPAWEAYQKVEAPALEAYQKVEAQALEAYQKVKAPAWEAYQKVKAPAWEAYQKSCTEILRSLMLKKRGGRRR